MIPIIDCGHGGFVDGKYTTGNKKFYKFDDGYEIYEGIVNRKIGQKLISFLNTSGFKYHDINSMDNHDMPLKQRVDKINSIYNNDSDTYLISIHSNSASATTSGAGTTAHGNEIWIYRNSTKSRKLAEIAADQYRSYFNRTVNFRGIKEAGFYILRHTLCQAFLVENMFFENRREAVYLMSEAGQYEIAKCLYLIIKKIYTL